jgi:hypothetical protein
VAGPEPLSLDWAPRSVRSCRYGRVNCHRRRTLSVQSPGRFCGYNAPGKLVATHDAGPVTDSAACRQRAGMLSRTVLPSVPGPRYRSWLNSQPRRKPPNHAASSGAWVIVLRRNGLAEAGCSSIWYRPAHSPGRLTGDQGDRRRVPKLPGAVDICHREPVSLRTTRPGLQGDTLLS